MRYSILFLLLLTNICAFSQDSFHRYYKHNNANTVNLDAMELNGGTFLSVDAMEVDSNGTFEKLLFTFLDNKGTVENSFTYGFVDDSTSFSFTSNTELIQSDTDSLFFSTIFSTEDEANRLTVGLSSDGLFAWAKIFSPTEEVKWDNNSYVHLINHHDQSLYQSYNAIFEGDSSAIILHNLNTSGEVTFTKKYAIQIAEDSTIEGTILGLSETTDTNTILMTGVDPSTMAFFMTSLDSLGQVNFSRSYRDTVNSIEQKIFYPEHIAMGNDGSFAISGQYEFVTPGNSKTGSFISRHDTIGKLMWTKGFDIGLHNQIYNIVINDDGSIFTGGNYDIGEEASINFPFSFIIDRGGNLSKAAQYMRNEALAHPRGGNVFAREDEGYGYFSPGLFGGTGGGQDTLSIFLKLDEDLMTPCNDSLDTDFAFDIPLASDTLIWYTENIESISIKDTVLFKQAYNGYAVPVMTLETKAWCPNEEIDWTFDARVDGAVSWKWSDGSTGDTLRVFDEGTFSVIVTMDDSFSCYILCDTTKVGRIEEPTVNVTSGLGNFCTNDKMTVTAQYFPGADLTDIVWSTGETGVRFIEVGEEINVSVRVTDACMEEAEGNVDVVFPDLIENVSIDADFSNFCDEFFGTLTPIADGAIAATTWTPLGNSNTLTITEPGVYGVSVSDICNNVSTSTIEIVPENFPDLVDDFDFVTSSENFCSDGLVTIGLNIIGNHTSIEWSNGSTDNSIDVAPGAQYTATVRDDCKSISKDITLDPIELACIKFPKIFIPRSENEDNKVFGGFTDQCPSSDYTGYELFVFNRWGQEVFSSTSVEDRWDGKINGDIAPPDVYVWHVKYNDGACVLEDKGDVTLFR